MKYEDYINLGICPDVINGELQLIKAIEEYYDYLAQEDKSADFAINFQSYKNKLKNKKNMG